MIPSLSLRRIPLCGILFLTLVFADWMKVVHAGEWGTIQVPGLWNVQRGSIQENLQRTAWYRCWVKVPDSYFSKHERNLFEESVGINLRDLVGTHEIWVNGLKIGNGATSQSNDQDGVDALFRYKVPVGTLKKGLWNELAVKMHDASGDGGFSGEAPFIMDYFLECVFEGEWEFRIEPDYQPGDALATKPNRASFETFR